MANPPKKDDLPPPLPALPPLGATEAEPEVLPLPQAPFAEPVAEPVVEAPAAPELPPLAEAPAAPAPVIPEPIAEEAPNVLPEAELESLPALTEKQNVAPAKVEKPGLFSGLTNKVGSLLGKKEEAPKPVTPLADEAPAAPEPLPAAEPLPSPDAEPVAEPAAQEAPALPPLPKSADATTAPELPKLPPLPKEDVPAVPVTDTTRALPSLDALKTQAAKPHEPSIAKAQPVTIVSEKELPALPSLNKKEATEVAKVAALDAAGMDKADVELELPPLPEAAPAVKEKVAAVKEKAAEVKAEVKEKAEEIELASLPPEPAAEKPAAKPAAKASSARKPEFGFDKESRKQLQLFFSRDDHDVDPAMHSFLNELAKTLKADNTKTLQVASYAGSNVDDPIVSKRVALSRAVNVRRYLIEAGVDSSRINVQPLGNQGGHQDPERVDITLK